MKSFCLVLLLLLVVVLSAADAHAGGTSTKLRLTLLDRQQLHLLDSSAEFSRTDRDDVAFFSPAAEVSTATASPDAQAVDWETGRGKSYGIAAWEVPTFLVALNLFDRIAYADQKQDGKKVYSSNFSTTWEHLTKQNWEFDKDPFNVNQFAHPYQGATMYGLARSAGLNFWESLVYSNVGSFIWKMAGETDPPSINDAVTTGNAGSLLGEALFRMAQLVLKDGGSHPDMAHEIYAGMLSPPLAFNRHVFGERFKPLFTDHDPAVFWRLRVGFSLDTNRKDLGNTTEVLNHDVTADFSMLYGLPGKPGYTYKRPLDYFEFQLQGQARTSNPVGNVFLRGLLYGDTYELGPNYRGIWGLYGSYDYVSPAVFRISTMAASLGTTAQYWVAPGIALQGMLLGGVGFGGAGRTPTSSGDRDYHYGVTPQGIASMRMIFGDRTLAYVSANQYYVTGAGSDNSHGSETIFRGNAGFTVRVYGRHGIGLHYVLSTRNAKYGNIPDHHQSEGSLSVVYTFLGASHFGAVEWRDHPQ